MRGHEVEGFTLLPHKLHHYINVIMLVEGLQMKTSLYSVSSGTTASFLPQSKDVWVGLNGNSYFSAWVNVSVVLCWWLTRSRRCCGADLLSSGRKYSSLTWLPLPGTPRFLSRRQLHIAACFCFLFNRRWALVQKTNITPLTQRAGTSAHAATSRTSTPAAAASERGLEW